LPPARVLSVWEIWRDDQRATRWKWGVVALLLLAAGLLEIPL
jgi:hypothetical protein